MNNAKKIGKFLKELRQEKNWTQEKLRRNLEEVEVAAEQLDVKSISDWENGKCITNIDILSALAKIYNVTLEEILEGSKIINIDLENEYFLYEYNWFERFPNIPGSNIAYDAGQKQIIKITKRFDKLLKICVERTFTRNEQKEFKFLFTHFYSLSMNDNTNKYNTNDYMELNRAIFRKLKETSKMSKEERLWSIKSLIQPKEKIKLKNWEIAEDLSFGNKYIKDRFSLLEFWEKDMFLSMFQNNDYEFREIEKLGSKYLEYFEKRLEKPYNKENYNKEIIKFLIKNGAFINKKYLNYIKKIGKKKKIIDRLDELYLECCAPLTIHVISNNCEDIYEYEVENNKKNRFLKNGLFHLVKRFLNVDQLDIDEFFNKIDKILIDENYKKEVIIELSKQKGIDVNREYRYIISDFNSNFSYYINSIKDFLQKEKEIEIQKKELKELERELFAGNEYFNLFESIEIGGDNFDEKFQYCLEINKESTKKEILNARLFEDTKNLLNEIDDLSLAEIRKKYFSKEVIVENEY